MKEYDVKITETLERTVTVQAESREEAQEQVEQKWNDSVYVLDAEDFTHADFAVTGERSMEKARMSVLLVEPEQHPKLVEIDPGLKSLQAAVGGDIEVVYPYSDPVGIVCGEESKLRGLPLNRALRDENGDVYDIVAGNFLVVGLSEDDFCSLTPEQANKFEALFHRPELFIRMGRSIAAMPIPDDIVAERQAAREKAAKAKAKPVPERDAI
ncbi:MAG: DUF3846 domain-containing protein [Clostridiales bacterium]|nr:DUF3846 domain-containing protein [Clostridiales bacterium]